MERKRGLSHHSQRPTEPPNWRGACRRSLILGLVLGLHGLLLMALLHLNWLRKTSAGPPNSRETVLQLQLITTHPPLRSPQPPIPKQMAKARLKAALAAPGRSPAKPPMAAQITDPALSQPNATLPALPSSKYRPYQTGGFQQARQNAQRGSAVRLPGSDARIIPGIQLTPQTSIKYTVNRVLKSVQCYDEQVSMQHHFGQFGTEQQIDRRLQADGCGPQNEQPAGAAAIERADQQVIQRP